MIRCVYLSILFVFLIEKQINHQKVRSTTLLSDLFIFYALFIFILSWFPEYYSYPLFFLASVLILKKEYGVSIFTSSIASFIAIFVIGTSFSLAEFTVTLLLDYGIIDFLSGNSLIAFLGLLVFVFSLFLTGFMNRIFRSIYVDRHLPSRFEAGFNVIMVGIILILSSLEIIFRLLPEIPPGYSAFKIFFLSLLLMTTLSFVAMLKDFIYEKKGLEILKAQVELDPMTGTMSKNSGLKYMKALMKKAASENNYITFGFIDMNNLKFINDRYGHLEGDRSIIETASIIKSNLRSSDIICRVGGDEFVIAFSGCHYSQAQDIMERIDNSLESLSRTLPYDISISTGLFEKEPYRKMLLEEIIRIVDEEMYLKKAEFKKKNKTKTR